MFDTHLYLAFVLAVTILMLIPGPNVALIVANSVTYGFRYGLLTVAGTSSAMVVQLGLTVLGLSYWWSLLLAPAVVGLRRHAYPVPAVEDRQAHCDAGRRAAEGAAGSHRAPRPCDPDQHDGPPMDRRRVQVIVG